MTVPGDESATQPTERIDKWLWAARFFKTRSMAAQAVSGGKVQVSEARVKPARKIRPGERLRIRRNETQWEVTVRALSERRLPAKEAVTLYEETPESLASRELESSRRKAEAAARSHRLGKPSKRDRRELARLKGRAVARD